MSKSNGKSGFSMLDVLAEKGIDIRVIEAPTKLAPVSESTKPTKPAKTAKGKPVAAAPEPKKFSFGKAPAVPKVAKAGVITAAQKAADRAEFDSFVDQVNESMSAAVADMWSIREADETTQRLYRARATELDRDVAEMLSYEAPFRLPAQLAYAEALVAGCPTRRDAISWVLDRLVADGFLEVSDAGVRIYGENYRLGADVRAEVRAQRGAQSIEALVTKAVELGKVQFEAERVALVTKAGGANQLTSEEVLAGKAGRVLLRVPDKSGSDGRFFKGGYLLVEVIDGKVAVLDAIGGIRKIGSQLAEEGTYLPVSQLVNERLNFGTTRFPPEVFNRLVAIHDMVRRGIVELQREEAEIKKAAEAGDRKTAYNTQVAAEREALAAKATATSTEFFPEKAVGVAFVDYGKGTFDVKDRETGKVTSWWNVILLVERREDGQIRIVETPERLKGLFPESAFEWTDPGDKFSGLGYPLGPILRTEFAKATSGTDGFRR